MRCALRVLLLLLLFCATSVSAEEKVPTFVTHLYGHTTVYGAPPWIRDNSFDGIETHRQEGKTPRGNDIFILEYIPKGEVFADWSELYAVHAERPLEGTVQDYAGGVYAGYTRACAAPSAATFGTPTERDLTFIVRCSSYLDRPDTGEFMMMRMVKLGDVLIRNYYHKRHPALDPEVEGVAAAMTREEFLRVADRIGKLQISSE